LRHSCLLFSFSPSRTAQPRNGLSVERKPARSASSLSLSLVRTHRALALRVILFYFLLIMVAGGVVGTTVPFSLGRFHLYLGSVLFASSASASSKFFWYRSSASWYGLQERGCRLVYCVCPRRGACPASRGSYVFASRSLSFLVTSRAE